MKKISIIFAVLTLSVIMMASGCSKKEDSGEAQNQNEEAEKSDQKSEKTLEELKGELKEIVEKQKTSNGYYYEYSVESEYSEGEKSQTRMKMWQQGEKIRTEVVDSEGNTISIMIQDMENDELYMYDAQQNIAYRQKGISEEGSETAEGEEVSPDEDIDWDGVVNIEDDKVDGRAAKRIIINDSQEGQSFESRMWIDEQTGIVIKMESYMEGKLVSQFKVENIKSGPFDDDVFKLPSGVKIIDMDSYMQQIPGAQE